MQQTDIDSISQIITDRFREARERYQLHNWERPVFSFDLKGTTAGQAHLGLNKIKINEGLFIRNKEEFLRQTLGHEVAHLAAYKAFNDRGHGSGWRRVMIDFRLEPKRCHSYDVSEVRTRVTRRFLYTCGCSQALPIPTNTHNKIKKRLLAGMGSGYKCRKCQCTLKYTGIEKIDWQPDFKG